MTTAVLEMPTTTTARAEEPEPFVPVGDLVRCLADAALKIVGRDSQDPKKLGDAVEMLCQQHALTMRAAEVRHLIVAYIDAERTPAPPLFGRFGKWVTTHCPEPEGYSLVVAAAWLKASVWKHAFPVVDANCNAAARRAIQAGRQSKAIAMAA